MTACAPFSLAETSETIACFCSRLRPKVYLLTTINGRLLAVPLTADPGIRNAVCAGRDITFKFFRTPTVFDDYCQSHCCAESEATSTFTPTPIVLDTESFFRKLPFVAAGL